LRDPKRIKRILKLIEKVWKKNPDLRLFQLLDNSFHTYGDYYYLEDENLEESLKEFYNE